MKASILSLLGLSLFLTWMNIVQNQNNAHFNMLEQQVRPGDVLDHKVLGVLKQIKRVDFVDESLSGIAYADIGLPIGHGQVMLPPILHGRMLQALDIQNDEYVLEVGTGSGYFTALIATLAQHVTTIEIMEELSLTAKQNIEAYDFDNITYCVGDASKTYPLSDRIDVIVLTAAFVTVPDDYLQSIKVGGRLLAVVGQEQNMEVQLIYRVAEREWQTKSVLETVIPAVINAEPKPEFKF
jgi:protein-L-isoaspartate(D-aspartate) O-methyltransferase